MPIRPILTAATVAATLAALPAAAKISVLTVTGTVLSGSDGGNDLVDVTLVNNAYVHTFAPGSFFGTPGDLTGKSIVFRLLYDTASAPAPDHGVFDDPAGMWPYTITPSVAIDGVGHPLYDYVSGTYAFAPTASLTLVDGIPDGLSAAFTGLTYSGNSLSDYRTSALSFSATLAPSFFSTDAVLPGAVADPHDGYARGPATGTGSFTFTRATCFLQCSAKSATGTFAIQSVAFGAVPEPAAWGLMTIGFGAVGALRRRQPATRTVAA